MNKITSRKRYLALNRMRIRRELDAMGYGQSRRTIPHFERVSRKRSTSIVNDIGSRSDGIGFGQAVVEDLIALIRGAKVR